MIRIRLCFSGMLILIFSAAVADVAALECGVLRLQAERSAGSDVVGNACNDSGTLAVDSIVQLRPGSKAWFESVPATASAAGFQIICQNESSLLFKIKVAHATVPWIRPEGQVRCGAWTKGRLNCIDPESQRTALICAIAQKKTWVATHEIQRNTSVVMRGGSGSAGSTKPGDSESEPLDSIIAEEINPKIGSCENLFDREVAIVWTISPAGRVTDAAQLKPVAGDRFADCVLEVVRTATFPAFSRAIQIHSSFK